jgi:hypothetical protein
VQTPFELQNALAEQFASLVHFVAHTVLMPSQRFGAHVGEPGLFNAATVHRPLDVAPSAAEQTSQEPPQAELQQ